MEDLPNMRLIPAAAVSILKLQPALDYLEARKQLTCKKEQLVGYWDGLTEEDYAGMVDLMERLAKQVTDADRKLLAKWAPPPVA